MVLHRAKTGASCHKGNCEALFEKKDQLLHKCTSVLKCICVIRCIMQLRMCIAALTGNIPSPSSMATIQSYKPFLNDFGPPSLGFPQVCFMLL